MWCLPGEYDQTCSIKVTKSLYSVQAIFGSHSLHGGVFSLLFITDLSSYNFFDEHIPLTPGSVDDEVDSALVIFLCATLPVNLQSHDLQILGHCPNKVCEVSGVGRSLKVGGQTKYERGGGGGGYPLQRAT